MLHEGSKLKLDSGEKVTIEHFINRRLDEGMWYGLFITCDYGIVETYLVKTKRGKRAIVIVRINMLNNRVDSTHAYILRNMVF